MKLDATDLRYVTSDEFRVLTAVRLLLLVVALNLTNENHRQKWARKIMKSSRYP